MRDLPPSDFLHKEACPKCGSRDNLARYTDGHGWCFGCSYHEGKSMGEGLEVSDFPSTESRERDGLQAFTGEVQDLPARGIREDTCRLFGYQVGDYKGKRCQAAIYRDPTSKAPLAAKLRFADKTFSFIGQPKNPPLYGQWLWGKGKMLVITEGEIDAMSVSQAQGNKWPVVSIPNGAQAAEKTIRQHLDWISGFDTVVLMFDMDEPGQKAAVACAQLLKPGTARIAHLSEKDPNELLKQGRPQEIVSAIWNAKPYRPDGIVSAADLWDLVSSDDLVPTVPYPYASLTQKTGGIRQGELVTITAGSGIGKSLFCREIAYDLMVNHGRKVGYVALEENSKRTLLGFVGMDLNRPLHIDRSGVTADDLRPGFDRLSDRLYLYDSFGSVDPDNLVDRLRYLAVACECETLVLDHISIAISGIEDIDERRALDVMMTKLRSLVEETGVSLFVVSHLRRPGGESKGHEQGAQVSLSQLRGSHSLAQLSDMVIGLERDQQGDDANTTTIRVLKNRHSGMTGTAGLLKYDTSTGRLVETLFEMQHGEAEF